MSFEGLWNKKKWWKKFVETKKSSVYIIWFNSIDFAERSTGTSRLQYVWPSRLVNTLFSVANFKFYILWIRKIEWTYEMETYIYIHQYCQFDFLHSAGNINGHKQRACGTKTNGWTDERTNKWMNAWKKNSNGIETNNASIVCRVHACIVWVVSIVLIKESTHMLITPIRKLIHTYVCAVRSVVL